MTKTELELGGCLGGLHLGEVMPGASSDGVVVERARVTEFVWVVLPVCLRPTATPGGMDLLGASGVNPDAAEAAVRPNGPHCVGSNETGLVPTVDKVLPDQESPTALFIHGLMTVGDGEPKSAKNLVRCRLAAIELLVAERS